MDTESLVEDLIDDGQKLIEYLPRNGFTVATALWLKASENDRWYFYLVSPLADTEGLPQAYRRLHTLIRQMPEHIGIDPLKIKLIGPDDPIAKDVLGIFSRVSGPQVSPVRWGGRTLGNISIEGAYLYPLPAAAV
jgi:hypothetical protein